MTKRQPLLADLALATPAPPAGFVSGRWHAQTMDWLRMAKRFVLDEEAAVYLGDMIRRYPRIIADAQDFAIQPYETMWVELPSRPFHHAVLGADSTGVENLATADTRLGYLYRAGSVRTFACGSDNQASIMPIEYRLHTPMTEEEQLALADALQVSRAGLDLWFWGASAKAYLGALCDNAEDERHTWDREGMRALRANHSVRLAPTGIPGQRRDLSTLYSGAAGDLRNVVALLLFLNRTANLQVLAGHGHGEGFIKGKLRPLLSHRVIKIKLDPQPRFLRLCAGAGVRRRLHDVRGCFCHDRLAREGCPHGEEHEGDFGDWWEEYEPLRWRCTHCGGHRWWRHEHKRGYGQVGEVLQTYQVVK